MKDANGKFTLIMVCLGGSPDMVVTTELEHKEVIGITRQRKGKSPLGREDCMCKCPVVEILLLRSNVLVLG